LAIDFNTFIQLATIQTEKSVSLPNKDILCFKMF